MSTIQLVTQHLADYSQLWGVDSESTMTPPAHPSSTAPLQRMPLPQIQSQSLAEGPCLDTPQMQEDAPLLLEKLLARLMLENNEQQIILAKERIESNQAEIHLRHEAQIEKLQASLEEAAKAETSSLITRVFSWIFTALSVVTAAGACIATGGVAVPAVAGAVIAVGMLALSESGATEKLTEALSASIKKTFDCPSNKADIGANVVLTAIMLVLSIGTMIGGGLGGAARMANQALSTSAHIAQTVQRAATIANGALSVASTATQGYGTAKRYESNTLRADATEITNLMAILQLALNDEKETLQTLLNAHQSTLAALSRMLERDAQTQNEITARISGMV